MLLFDNSHENHERFSGRTQQVLQEGSVPWWRTAGAWAVPGAWGRRWASAASVAGFIPQHMRGTGTGKAILRIPPQTSDPDSLSASINAGSVREWILIILIMSVWVCVCWVRSGRNCRGLSRQKCFCRCLYHRCPLSSVVWRKRRHAHRFWG